LVGRRPPPSTIGEVSDWAAFRTKLKRLNEAFGLPWPELKTRVKENRIPSGIIHSALNRFRPHSPEWKGSDLIDTHLACLSPYSDITFVDKRTHEGLQTARKKVKELPAILRRIEKAKNTRVVLEHLVGGRPISPVANDLKRIDQRRTSPLGRHDLGDPVLLHGERDVYRFSRNRVDVRSG
jgi:hypothetical protein